MLSSIGIFTFCTKKQYNFVTDSNVLETFYSPIIGREAISLYYSLISEASLSSALPNASSDSKDFLTRIKVSSEEFEKLRKKLEAIDLLSSYHDGSQYIFILKNHMNPSEIFKDIRFCDLLKTKISDFRYEELKYFYDNNEFTTVKFLNISEDFSFLTQNKSYFSIDYKKIEQLIDAKFKTICSISDANKKIIDKYETKLDIEKIVSILSSSIETDGMHSIFSNDKIHENITAYFNSICSQNASTHLIKRNRRLFSPNHSISLQDKEEIFQSYKSVSTYDYIKSITKTNLEIADSKFIDKMLAKVPAEILNMVFDYVLAIKTQTGSHFSMKYIEKTVITINEKGLSTLEDLLEHLVQYKKTYSPTKNEVSNSSELVS
jgi:replication initiation and membrane attachment protein DnaB